MPLIINDRLAIEDSEIDERFVRASGPGGQNVNKVATAVQLRFDVEHSPSLADEVRHRLRALAGSRMTAHSARNLRTARTRVSDSST